MADDPAMTALRRLLPTAVAVLGVVVFIAFLVFLAVRDGRAEDRCVELGGQTWDSGEHCVLGDPRIVSTR